MNQKSERGVLAGQGLHNSGRNDEIAESELSLVVLETTRWSCSKKESALLLEGRPHVPPQPHPHLAPCAPSAPEPPKPQRI
eukprot:1603669-Amphidinium_carterae.1